MEILLKYIASGVGVYIEYSNKKWDDAIERKLERQLDGFQLALDETQVKQKLIFKDYCHLDFESLEGGCVAPENSIYKKDVFVDLRLKIAFKIEQDNMVFWVHEKSGLSLPFILQFLLKQQNLVFIHGAGITIENKGVLLPSFSGIGKTPFISEAVKDKRVKVLGDDLVLYGEGYLYPYGRPCCLHSYHKSLFPEYFKKNKVKFKRPTLWNRGIMKIKSILDMPYEDIYGAKTVAPYLLFGKNRLAEDRVPIEKVYLLRRYRGLADMKGTRTESIDEIVNFCVNVLFHEWECHAKMTFSLLAQRGEGMLNYYDFFEKNIRDCITKAKDIFLVDIPENMKIDDVAVKLAEIVLSEE